MKPNLHNTATILLIDDDDDEDCHFFEEALSQISPRISLHCLSNADQLLQVIENMNPSLVFVDYHPGEEKGIDCVRKIKAHPQFRVIPVILWSTAGTTQEITAAYVAGAQLYMEKPWDLKKLEEQVKKILWKYDKI